MTFSADAQRAPECGGKWRNKFIWAVERENELPLSAQHHQGSPALTGAPLFSAEDRRIVCVLVSCQRMLLSVETPLASPWTRAAATKWAVRYTRPVQPVEFRTQIALEAAT